MINVINTPSLGNISVSTDPYQSDNQAVTSGTLSRNQTVTIPAGQYIVNVYNDGLEPITVAGQSVPTGNTLIFQAEPNPATQRLDLTPAITITTPDSAGASASYYYTSPSS